jgi:AAA+ ATPase superfamily predicted ATPase
MIYFLARKARNVEKFKEQCVDIIPEVEIIIPEYEALFEFIKDKVDAVIIDEFPEMVKENENILNIFQYIVDIVLKDSSLKLFLLGSSLSVMKSQVLSTPSPLYGRKTVSLHLKPFKFHILKEFFPNATLEEVLQIYGFSGGIPYYLNKIEQPFWDWLNTELKQQTFIRDEAEFLLRYEFLNSGRYFSILEAIAFGMNQLNQISQYTNIPVTSLPQYLNSLDEVNFIKREIPITERQTSKRGRYILRDNFLRFYFKFIYPNLESLDRKIMNIENIKKKYSQYMGKVFEDVVLQFLITFRDHPDLVLVKHKPFLKFTKIGRWWWRDAEIDLIAINPESDKVLLIECKWQDKVNGREIAMQLHNKLSKVRYKGKYKDKKHILMIFAKSFENTTNNGEQIGPTSTYYFDLDDMSNIITK